MKTPAPRGIGVAGEEGDTKSDRRILNALRLLTQAHPWHPIGEIVIDIVVAVLARRHALSRRRFALVAEFALGGGATC